MSLKKKLREIVCTISLKLKMKAGTYTKALPLGSIKASSELRWMTVALGTDCWGRKTVACLFLSDTKKGFLSVTYELCKLGVHKLTRPDEGREERCDPSQQQQSLPNSHSFPLMATEQIKSPKHFLLSSTFPFSWQEKAASSPPEQQW